MTDPGPAPDPAPIVSRSDAAPLAREQVMSMMFQESKSRRHAATRAHVGGDGKVMYGGRKHIGTIHKTAGMAWRARDPKGNLIGLHASKAEAAGALVLRHEGQ